MGGARYRCRRLAQLEDQLDRMDRSIRDGRHARLSPRQPRLPFHDLPRGRVADDRQPDRDPVAPDQPLLQSSSGIGKLRLGEHPSPGDGGCASPRKDEAAARAAIVADITGSFEVARENRRLTRPRPIRSPDRPATPCLRSMPAEHAAAALESGAGRQACRPASSGYDQNSGWPTRAAFRPTSGVSSE